MSMFRRAMDYLGLGPDEAYDSYDESQAVARTDRRRSNPLPRDDRHIPDEDDFAPRRRQVDQNDSGVTLRPSINTRGDQVARPALGPVDPVTLRPQTYEDAKEIADLFKQGNPVIINVLSTDPKIMRRIIDFASGVCYANNGTMEKMTKGVFMMKPFGARVSRG